MVRRTVNLYDDDQAVCVAVTQVTGGSIRAMSADERSSGYGVDRESADVANPLGFMPLPAEPKPAVPPHDPDDDDLHSRGAAESCKLRHDKDFNLLWTGQGISQLGSEVTAVVLPLIALKQCGATPFQVGVLAAFTTISFMLFSLPAGVVVDSRRKRGLMVGCNLLRLVLIGGLGLLLLVAPGALEMWHLFVVAFATGTCRVFFDLAYQSYVPTVVRKEQLASANGTLEAARSTAFLGGYSVSGFLYKAAGPAGALLVDAASYLVSVVTLLGIRKREPEPVPAQVSESPKQQIMEGLRFVMGHHLLRPLLVSGAAINFFAGMSGTLMMVFLVSDLEIGEGKIGLFFACSGLGGILAGFLCGTVTDRLGVVPSIWVSLLVLSVPQWLCFMAGHDWRLWLFPVGCFFGGISVTIYNVAQMTFRQAVTPHDMLGRMNATVRWLTWSMLSLGGVLGGALGSLLGARAGLAIALVGIWGAGWVVLCSPLRRLRDVPDQPVMPV